MRAHPSIGASESGAAGALVAVVDQGPAPALVAHLGRPDRGRRRRGCRASGWARRWPPPSPRPDNQRLSVRSAIRRSTPSVSSPPRPTTKVDEPDAPEAAADDDPAGDAELALDRVAHRPEVAAPAPAGMGQHRHLAFGHRNPQRLGPLPHQVLLVGVGGDLGQAGAHPHRRAELAAERRPPARTPRRWPRRARSRPPVPPMPRNRWTQRVRRRAQPLGQRAGALDHDHVLGPGTEAERRRGTRGTRDRPGRRRRPGRRARPASSARSG